MAKKLDDVYVATDSEEIRRVVEEHGGKAILTSSKHETGTDRIAEAVNQVDCDIAVNVQGDEALVQPAHIDLVVSTLHLDPTVQVAILVTPFQKYNSSSDIKAVLNERNDVMYFSRSDIPSPARTPSTPLLKACHIVPFNKEFLLQYAKWKRTPLETIEYNEYLRILEKGFPIRAVFVDSGSISVDTQEDLEYVRALMERDSLFLSYSYRRVS